jgi:hypothetical protein
MHRPNFTEIMKKIFSIFVNTLPVLLMILLIPFVKNDYLLAVIYFVLTVVAFVIKRNKNDFLFYVFGFFIMILSEYLFTSTGVETFNRNTLFGLMPIWLPLLWAYGFVVIKRSAEILNS